MTKCDKCPRDAIIYQRYSGMRLCREHFEDDVHRKIREALRKTGLFSRDAHVAVGLDGGRKSATLAFVLKNLFARRKDIDLLAVIIDEGRKTGPTADQARHVAERLETPYIVKSLPLVPARYSHTESCRGHDDLPDRNSEYQQPLCIDRNALKRELLFCTAKENGAGILATGESLDDEALEIFIGYLKGDADAVMSEEQCVAWIKPLRRIPEKEVRLYAICRDLGFADEMPNVCEKTSAGALRLQAKRLLFGFDSRHPGTNYSLLRGLEKAQAREEAGKGKAFK